MASRRFPAAAHPATMARDLQRDRGREARLAAHVFAKVRQPVGTNRFRNMSVFAQLLAGARELSFGGPLGALVERVASHLSARQPRAAR